MRLCIPFDYEGKRIEEFEVRGLTAEQAANVRRCAVSHKGYEAIKLHAEYCLAALGDETGQVQVQNMVRQMPFFSAFQVGVFGIVQERGKDNVSSSYTCPKCGEVRVYEETRDDDMSDHVYDIEVDPDPETELSFSLETPVEIRNKNTQDLVLEAREIRMRHPTILDYMKAEQRYPDDAGNTMFFAYGQAVVAVDGERVDEKFRQKYGDLLFRRMTNRDVNRISERLMRHAFGQKMERVCLACHHRWETTLNTSGFFDSGPQGG